MTTQSSYAPYWSDPSWNVCYLGGIALPGLVSCTEEVKRNFKVGTTQGIDAAPVTPKGSDPKRISLLVKLTTPKDWQDWQDTVKRLNLDVTGKTQVPYDIIHPAAQHIGIRTVNIETVTIPAPSLPNPLVITIKCIETGITMPTKVGAPDGPAGSRFIPLDPKNGPQP